MSVVSFFSVVPKIKKHILKVKDTNHVAGSSEPKSTFVAFCACVRACAINPCATAASSTGEPLQRLLPVLLLLLLRLRPPPCASRGACPSPCPPLAPAPPAAPPKSPTCTRAHARTHAIDRSSDCEKWVRRKWAADIAEVRREQQRKRMIRVAHPPLQWARRARSVRQTWPIATLSGSTLHR